MAYRLVKVYKSTLYNFKRIQKPIEFCDQNYCSQFEEQELFEIMSQTPHLRFDALF